jgi:chromosome segregation ATPase
VALRDQLNAANAELEQLRIEVKKLAVENDRLRKRIEKPKPRRVAAVYEKLGAPPTDPLLATEWAHKLLIASIHRAARDTSITEAEARREISQLAAQAKDLIPLSRKAAAERAINQEAAALADGGGPELVNARPRPGGGGASGDRPQPRRGRPPKQSLR